MDHLHSITSYDVPIKLQFLGFDREKLFIKKWGYRFPFEVQWLENDECREIVKNEWSGDLFRSVKLTWGSTGLIGAK